MISQRAIFEIGGGIAIGVVSFFASKHIYEAKYEKLLAENRESIKLAYARLMKRKTGLTQDENELAEALENEVERYQTIPGMADASEKSSITPVKLNRESYFDYSAQYRDAEKDVIAQEDVEPEKSQEPIVLTEAKNDADVWDDPRFENYSLAYYSFFAQNCTFADESGEVVSSGEADSLFGHDNITNYVMGAAPDKTIYIQNDQVGATFAIDIIDESYPEAATSEDSES
jgi:hypothetical protein